MKILKETLTEKQQQVEQLTSINVELEEKIENMIKQTRSDLENLSNKYKLPQLETMNEELLNAEEKIKELEQKLNASEAEVKELRTKLSNSDLDSLKLKLRESEESILALEKLIKKNQGYNENEMYLKDANEKLKEERSELLKMLNDLENYKSSYELLHKEYNQLTAQLKELNTNKNTDTKDLATLRSDLENFWSIYNEQNLDNKYIEVKIASWINQVNLSCMLLRKFKDSESTWQKTAEECNNNLRQSEKEVGKLTELIEELNNSKTLLEGEKQGIEIELKATKVQLNEKIEDYKALLGELENRNKEIVTLKNQLGLCKNEDKNVTIQTLEDASQHLEEAKSELMKYQDALNEKCESIKKYEAHIEQLQEEVKITSKNLEVSQKEVEKLQSTVKELLEDNMKKTTREDGDKCE